MSSAATTPQLSHADQLQYQHFKAQHCEQLQLFIRSLFDIQKNFHIDAHTIIDGTFDPISYPVKTILTGAHDQWKAIVDAAQNYYFYDASAHDLVVARLREETLFNCCKHRDGIRSGRLSDRHITQLFQR